MADTENALGRRQSTVEERDEEELAEFGYKQELRRDWGLMHNFGISFSIIVSFPIQYEASLLTDLQSVITGITTLFQYGLVTGGPGGMSPAKNTMEQKTDSKKSCPWAGSSYQSSQCSSLWEWQKLSLRFQLLEVHITGLQFSRLRSTLHSQLG